MKARFLRHPKSYKQPHVFLSAQDRYQDFRGFFVMFPEDADFIQEHCWFPLKQLLLMVEECGILEDSTNYVVEFEDGTRIPYLMFT